MERYWLLTNTCYGNWLPGDARGFVGRVSAAIRNMLYDQPNPLVTWSPETGPHYGAPPS